MIIHGVLASMMMAPPPSGGDAGTALIDFVSGTYTVGGTSVTAADVVSDTDRISEDGLSILPGTAVNYLGTFRDLLYTANWTVVFDLDLLEPEAGPPDHRNWLVWMDDAGSASLRIELDAGSPWLFEFDGSTTRSVFDTEEGVVGLNRLAVTRTNDLGAVSLNGAAAVSDATALITPTFISAEGSYHNKSNPAGFIRSIEIMPPQSAAALPALSSLS